MGRTKIGTARVFFEKALASCTDECVIWPYAIQPNTGYPWIKIDGHSTTAHRAICLRAHGECPEGHETAHSCGVRACINPKHLSWKTRTANMADKTLHGTDNAGDRNGQAKLNWAKVHNIRANTLGLNQIELAKEHGVSTATISLIQRDLSWKKETVDG